MSGKSISRALEQLLTENDAVIRAAVARHCPARLRGELDDILQEVRRRIWRALSAERKIQHPSSYLYRVAVTASIDAIRKADARREVSLDEAIGQQSKASSPESTTEQQSMLDTVQLCLAGLHENRRQAVKLHLLGLTTQEIAITMNWTEPKARNLAYRGLSDLREALKALGIDYEIN